MCVGGQDKIQAQEVDYEIKRNFIASLPSLRYSSGMCLKAGADTMQTKHVT